MGLSDTSEAGGGITDSRLASTRNEPRPEDHAGASRRRGRPARPIAEVRRNRLVTFVTDQDLEILEARSRAEDRSLSALVYELIQPGIRNHEVGECD